MASVKREYKSWSRMISRCHNEADDRYEYYGARGISVCKRWRDSFENFYADMGPRPAGTSIDRVDNGGDYEPSNCRWATKLEQANNRRNNRVIEVDGIADTIAGWSRRTGVSASTIQRRLSFGWSAEEALQEPVKVMGLTIAVGGATLSVDEWAERLGIDRTAITKRLKSGWDPTEAVTTPSQRKKR